MDFLIFTFCILRINAKLRV